MAYGIHRADKAKAADLTGLEMEANRTEKDRHNFPKSDIDWERTKYNYHFVKSENWDATIRQIVKDYGITKTIRKDAVMMIDGLYTASPEFFEGKTQEEIKEYFRECLEFHKEHYGVVFNAVVHLDEKTPHMAVASVPLVKNEDGSFSLSAKRCMGGRVDYHDRQDEFYIDVSEKHGLERGEVQNPEARREHLDNLDFKLQMREEEIKAAEAEKIEIEQDIGKLERIREIISTVKDLACDLFTRVYCAIKEGFHNLCDKIEHNQSIKPEDLVKADCKMKKYASCTLENGDILPMYAPRTNAGEPLTWAGNRPVYCLGKGEYIGLYSADRENNFTRIDSPDWEGVFCRGKQDFDDSVCDKDIVSLEDKIDLIDRIVNEEDPVETKYEDRELPEEIDFDDVEESSSVTNEDDDPDDYDPVCV